MLSNWEVIKGQKKIVKSLSNSIIEAETAEVTDTRLLKTLREKLSRNNKKLEDFQAGLQLKIKNLESLFKTHVDGDYILCWFDVHRKLQFEPVQGPRNTIFLERL